MYSENSGRNQKGWLPEIKPAPHLSILKIPVCSKCVHETWCTAANLCILSASIYWIVFAVSMKSQKGVLGRTHWCKTASMIVHCYLQLHLQNDTSLKKQQCPMSSSTIPEKLSFLENRTLCITINWKTTTSKPSGLRVSDVEGWSKEGEFEL